MNTLDTKLVIDQAVAAGTIKPDLNPTDAATPCGLIAKSLFNDTF
jgi:hypothetical protein